MTTECLIDAIEKMDDQTFVITKRVDRLIEDEPNGLEPERLGDRLDLDSTSIGGF